MILRLPLVLILLLTTALAGAAQAQPAEKVVHDFYDRWSRGDTVGAVALWTDARREHATKLLANVGCVTFDALTIGAPEKTGDAGARVLVDGIVTRLRAGTRWRTYSDPHRAIVTLEQHGQSWWITDWRLREEDLVSALAKATTDAERSALLAESVDLQTPELGALLCRRAVEGNNKGEIPLTRDLLRVAVELGVQLRDKRIQAEALSVTSVLYRWPPQQDYPKSLALAREAASAAIDASDPDVLARALQRLGRTQFVMGADTSEALEQALDLAGNLVDVTPAALAATDLARMQEKRRNYRLALAYGTEALSLAERANNASAIINASMILGGLNNGQNDPRLAALHFERALAVARSEGYASSIDDAIISLGYSALKAGDLVTARKWSDQAFQFDDPGKFVLRAWVSFHERQFGDAECEFREAYACSLNDNGRASWMADMALLKLEMGEIHEASGWLDRSDSLLDDSTQDNTSLHYANMTLRARISLALGAVDEAVLTLRDAVENGETLGRQVGIGVGQQAGGFIALDYAYRELIDALVGRGAYLEAFQYSERMRARLLREFLTGKRLDLRSQISPEERTRHASLIERVQSLNEHVMTLREGSQEWMAVQKQLDRARLELEDFESRVGTAKETETIASISNEAFRLPPVAQGKVVLSYVVSDRHTIIFAIDSDPAGRARLRAKRVRIAGTKLTKRVDSLVKALEQRSLRYDSEASDLYKSLVEPVAPFLRGRRAVTIVPDGVLWNVPFHALKRAGGTYLIERMAVSYAPAVGFLDATRFAARAPSDSPTEDLVAFADPMLPVAASRKTFPSLPDADREVREIASLYPKWRTKVRMGEAARESFLRQEGGHARILHFATHAIADLNAPLFSAVLLAPGGGEDGLLEVREIMNLRLNADLAVLSACETGRGPVLLSEGRISLSWAFMLAGCASTIVSQWKADSAGTASLMIEFHRQLVAGASIAEALRRAQRVLIRSEHRWQPYYWAAFIAMGRADEVLYPRHPSCSRQAGSGSKARANLRATRNRVPR